MTQQFKHRFTFKLDVITERSELTVGDVTAALQELATKANLSEGAKVILFCSLGELTGEMYTVTTEKLPYIKPFKPASS